MLLGASGCGKTTLLRLVSGLDRQSSGQIKIGPKVVDDVPPRDRGIAMVFQNYAVFPHLTVFENIAFGLRMKKMAEPDVLLMDEPLSNLDALLRLEMRAELKGLVQNSKTTTIYVTHDRRWWPVPSGAR